MMQGLTLLALGSPVAAGAAPKGIDTRNSAGLDVNKKSRFEDLDISSAINKPVGAPVEEPPAQKQAPTQSAIFADDALGYAFAVPPSFQGQSKAIDNGGQIIAFTDVSLNPPDITKRITLDLCELHGLTDIQPRRWEKTPLFDKDGRPVEHLKTAPRAPGVPIGSRRSTKREALIAKIEERGLKRPKKRARHGGN